MKKKVLLSTLCLLSATANTVHSQQAQSGPLPVRLVNVGRMAVAPGSGAGTNLYVPYSVLMTDDPAGSGTSKVSILQEGVTALSGNFYQESESHVFATDDNDDWGTSTGTIVFVGDNASGSRVVQTRAESDMANFDRASRYVAFPHVVLATDDTVKIHSRMGIDAASIAYRNNSEKGILYLYSDTDAGATKVFDASLRVSGEGVANAADRTSEKLVAAGSVVVERELSIYRGGTGLLFPFAAPFTNLRAGYFAGNFVRAFTEDPASGHVEYVLANRDANSDGYIDSDQYMRKADTLFTAGKGYLIKPRPAGYDYGNLIFDQTGGGGSNMYDQGKFVFNGKPWDLPVQAAKQLYAADTLFAKSLSGVTYNSTVNWIVGNSYTSALSVAKLYDAMANTGLTVSPIIHVYRAGSTGYIPYDVTGKKPNPEKIDEIPSMTYVMIRASKDVQNGSFAIDRYMQTHGKLSNNFLRAAASHHNELVFRVTPADNDNVYDLAMIALRSAPESSIQKIRNPQKDAFQLFAADNQSVAIEQEGTRVVPLRFVPSAEESRYTLSVSRVESMQTEAVLLEDRLTDVWTDLRTTDSYSFESGEEEADERFFVHFVPRATTGTDLITQSPFRIAYRNGAVVLSGLTRSDLDSRARVTDLQGRELFDDYIRHYPEESFAVVLPAGIYLAHVGGERNQTIKFIVKENR